MKVLHVSCVRKLSDGQRKQLSYEYEAAKRLHNIKWDVVVLTSEKPSSDFEKQIPLLLRPIFLRTLYAWIFMLQQRNTYNFILCRHMVFDVFSIFFASFLKNRITIHHSKEVQELLLVRRGFIGRFASFLEEVLGKFSLRFSCGIVGVTDEIRTYELSRFDGIKPSSIYPNGIVVDGLDVLEDCRDSTVVNAAFVCGKFSSWHGLEYLFSSAARYVERTGISKVKIHLIGGLLDSQLKTMSSNDDLRKIFVVHGHLSFDEYKNILRACDVGLASFALAEKGLLEASTLKVREYLALGLPVYSGHDDKAVDGGISFYVKGNPSIAAIEEYGVSMKKYSRFEVFSSTYHLVDKKKIMENLVDWLRSIEQSEVQRGV